MLLNADFGVAYFLAVVLAVWRTTMFVAYEHGPLGLGTQTRKILHAIGMRGLADCFHCLSFWLSCLLTLVVFRPAFELVLIAIAVAGGSSFMERLVSFDKE